MQADSEHKPAEAHVSRRDLMKVGAALLGALGLTQFIGLNDVRVRGSETDSEGGRKWGMLIDINKCIGCNYCTYACQAVNNLADDMLYNVVTTETTQSGGEFYLSRPCMQCAEAPCVHVCPVQATYYRRMELWRWIMSAVSVAAIVRWRVLTARAFSIGSNPSRPAQSRRSLAWRRWRIVRAAWWRNVISAPSH